MEKETLEKFFATSRRHFGLEEPGPSFSQGGTSWQLFSSSNKARDCRDSIWAVPAEASAGQPPHSYRPALRRDGQYR